MLGRHLLLDIDGVIVRDKLLLAHVKSNCTKYVASKLPESDNPREVNRVLYLAHGHTARGLKNVFNIDTKDFNEKVYDKPLLEHLAEVIYSPDFQDEAKEIHAMTTRGFDVTLFTNAPIEWAAPVARAISDKLHVKCSGPDPCESYLKPELGMYNFPKDKKYVYVDDCLKNLGTARRMLNWCPVHFKEEGVKDRDLWCHQIGSIWELSLLMNSAI